MPADNATQTAQEPPPTPVSAGEGLNVSLHHPIPAEMVVPPEEALKIEEARTTNWWAGRLLHYYHSIYTGNTYTWAAQLSVNSNLQFDFYIFSGATYGGTACQMSVLDHTLGALGVYTTPSLWINLPGKGEQYWDDSCNPGRKRTIPVTLDFRWLVSAVDRGLTRLRFQNSRMSRPFNDFVMQRIR
jgi:hypothetical protein